MLRVGERAASASLRPRSRCASCARRRSRRRRKCAETCDRRRGGALSRESGVQARQSFVDVREVRRRLPEGRSRLHATLLRARPGAAADRPEIAWAIVAGAECRLLRSLLAVTGRVRVTEFARARRLELLQTVSAKSGGRPACLSGACRRRNGDVPLACTPPSSPANWFWCAWAGAPRPDIKDAGCEVSIGSAHE